MASFRQRRRLPDITEAMTITNPLAAGIDVGSRFHAVAIPPHLAAESCRTFGCTTPDLQELAAWIHQYGITTVALESTGNYWVQPLRILEAAGFHVILVHPAYARQAKRTKYSDLDDSVWLQLMHSYGLLPASFQPPALFIRLRCLWRHRDRLIAEQGRCLQQMQDALELMNVQLHKVLSDIAGLTGLAIIRAIVAGERDPAHLAKSRDWRVKCSSEDLIKALTGDYREEEVFILAQRLARYDFTQQQLTELDAQIERRLAALQALCPPPPVCVPSASPAPAALPTTGKPNVAPPLTPRKSRSKQEPTAYDWHARVVALCGIDLTRICGLSVLLVLALIAELGVDLSPWASAQQFTAWLGLAPDHRVTGGKVIKRQTRRGKPHAAHFFFLAALAVAKSHTPLGEFYRYQKARMGPRKALTATARKIAILYYHLLKYGPAFVEEGQRRLAENAEGRKRRRLQRLAAELGVQIVERPCAA
jgi:transposase